MIKIVNLFSFFLSILSVVLHWELFICLKTNKTLPLVYPCHIITQLPHRFKYTGYPNISWKPLGAWSKLIYSNNVQNKKNYSVGLTSSNMISTFNFKNSIHVNITFFCSISRVLPPHVVFPIKTGIFYEEINLKNSHFSTFWRLAAPLILK